jgi:threonine/homoserine/homoserine lactone efflux protein
MVADTTNLPLFLLSVFAISTTGAMMPGPVTAFTVAQGSQRREAGALIAIGHGIVDLMVILLIYFGLASFMDHDPVRVSVGIIGGTVLLWMALGLFRNTPTIERERRDRAHGSVLGGVALTLANPYFFIWWATVGAALIVSARDFGGPAVAAMGITHWLCDFGWLFLVSWVVFKSKRLWTEKVNRAVFGVCSAVLAGFGTWFIVSSIRLAVSG